MGKNHVAVATKGMPVVLLVIIRLKSIEWKEL